MAFKSPYDWFSAGQDAAFRTFLAVSLDQVQAGLSVEDIIVIHSQTPHRGNIKLSYDGAVKLRAALDKAIARVEFLNTP